MVDNVLLVVWGCSWLGLCLCGLAYDRLVKRLLRALHAASTLNAQLLIELQDVKWRNQRLTTQRAAGRLR